MGRALTVEADGGSRGNPGVAGWGAVVRDRVTGAVLHEGCAPLGKASNNVAEYTAVIRGLERAHELGATDVLLRSDSQLLINQLTGRYRVKTPHLQPLHRRVRQLAARFDAIEFEHVRRERNTEADRLANEGVDSWLAAR